jgi:hypothetical protein
MDQQRGCEYTKQVVEAARLTQLTLQRVNLQFQYVGARRGCCALGRVEGGWCGYSWAAVAAARLSQLALQTLNLNGCQEQVNGGGSPHVERCNVCCCTIKEPAAFALQSCIRVLSVVETRVMLLSRAQTCSHPYLQSLCQHTCSHPCHLCLCLHPPGPHSLLLFLPVSWQISSCWHSM